MSCGFVLYCSDVLEGDISSWPEFNSQGVYHGLSAKKTDSCLQGEARGQAGTLAVGHADRCKAQPPSTPSCFCALALHCSALTWTNRVLVCV